MNVTKVLSTAMLFLLPGAIVTAYAQEHEQEKKPEQKQEQAKPAKQQAVKPAKQQQAKPVKQQAQHEPQAKPAKQPQQAARHQQAKPAKQPHENRNHRGVQRIETRCNSGESGTSGAGPEPSQVE